MMSLDTIINKISEIEQRMDYITRNYGSDTDIDDQEIRFVFSLYLYGLYKNSNVIDIAKVYLQKIKEKRRLDSESLLTAISSLLILDMEFTEYWKKLKEKIERSRDVEKYYIVIHFLIILTSNILKKFNNKDKDYIMNLLEELKEQDIERKLFSYWIKRRIFHIQERIEIPQNQIKSLKEYLLWEVTILEKPYEQMKKLRARFFSEILNYKIYKIDWIAFLIYCFLRSNSLHIITETELNKKIISAINRKVWFPLIFSMIFVFVKLYKASELNVDSVVQIVMLTLGAVLLFFEERMPSFEIPVKRHRVTFGQIGELLIIFSILWVLDLISIIKVVFP